MEKENVFEDGGVEAFDRRVLEYAQKMGKIDRQTRSLISSDMEIEAMINELKRIWRATNEDEATQEGAVTQLTDEIRKHCDAVDSHFLQ
jgi:hypothetical protein